ncbi:MAG: hypothetical protein M1828_006825 [Chrysothrix sp. TS-e1954]|nr:MAG: hypothetical protein M1828_006825 [Chrysothrix sp. TS-e1954]
MSTISLRKGAGVVVSAGKMQKTVKVRMVEQQWDRHLRKHWKVPKYHLVNDPNSSLLEGDVVTLSPERHSKRVEHTVDTIVAPFSEPLSGRPPLLTAEQREEIWATKRKAKLERMALRGRLSASKELRERGWNKSTQGPRKLENDTRMEDSKALEDGPEVLSGSGLHKYGKINEEAQIGKSRSVRRKEGDLQNRKRVEGAQHAPADQIARTILEQQ